VRASFANSVPALLSLRRFNFWWIVVPLCVIWACWHRAAAALSK
jgi:hypothetical protein